VQHPHAGGDVALGRSKLGAAAGTLPSSNNSKIAVRGTALEVEKMANTLSVAVAMVTDRQQNIYEERQASAGSARMRT
jgi:hypothetical protein